MVWKALARYNDSTEDEIDYDVLRDKVITLKHFQESNVPLAASELEKELIFFLNPKPYSVAKVLEVWKKRCSRAAAGTGSRIKGVFKLPIDRETTVGNLQNIEHPYIGVNQVFDKTEWPFVKSLTIVEGPWSD